MESPPNYIKLLNYKKMANSLNFEVSEFYQDYDLARYIAAAGMQLVNVTMRKVDVDGDLVVVCTAKACRGDGLLQELTIWSRDLVGMEDTVPNCVNDLIIRFGYYTDEETGAIIASKPKMVNYLHCGIWQSLSGGKRQFKAQAEDTNDDAAGDAE